ncbi:MAG: hypothetical protein PHV71_04145 [Eubacteriales bacterium]|nr:hypothetical protein [Eubacteriales bacterium]
MTRRNESPEDTAHCTLQQDYKHLPTEAVGLCDDELRFVRRVGIFNASLTEEGQYGKTVESILEKRKKLYAACIYQL